MPRGPGPLPPSGPPPPSGGPPDKQAAWPARPTARSVAARAAPRRRVAVRLVDELAFLAVFIVAAAAFSTSAAAATTVSAVAVVGVVDSAAAAVPSAVGAMHPRRSRPAAGPARRARPVTAIALERLSRVR